ncbi:ROK family transcriptional regulator [Ornithinimicrobium cerasi]|uniref:Sugar kinase of the NBD/HSP70 family, may contain an N-terminal HTH domain n=1 Tax=Ornithinimicrobium cerasi TaxID=2248773 RepID=A0A285VM23_9MICO|nr:ROK family transcriptional regulator [Ornithinimicrobium cerasi]SOC53621.1 Sugar kinase of the NBD/HSP70 family, may contain an N-terminal HTH domain [Ornithinimicrobium cerasi]
MTDQKLVIVHAANPQPGVAGRCADVPVQAGDILQLIRSGEATTRGDLLEATGLSRMTVAQRVDLLLASGLVVETSSATAGRGRPRQSLGFNHGHSVVAVAAVDTTHTITAVTDLDGRILARDRIEPLVADGPLPTLSAVGESLRSLLTPDLPPLAGIGIGVPGPVDPATGRPSEPPIMPGWDAYPIAEHLREHVADVPVHTANDADAAAVGEYVAEFRGCRSLVMVKVSTGIGTGIVLGGQRYVGVDGGAGDIGHVRVEHPGVTRCQCGSMGCLAAVASGRAVAGALHELGREAAAGHDVGALLRAGDHDALRLTREAGQRIGEVLATVVCVLNPEVVVVGGDLASTSLITGIRETLYGQSLPRATRHLRLLLGSLGEDAAVIGLNRIVVDDEFGPEAVNHRLAPATVRPERLPERS